MEMQNQIKEYVAQYEKEVRKLADQLRNESMPQLTEELFSEFETNGNRIRYEAVYFGRRFQIKESYPTTDQNRQHKPIPIN